MLTIIQYIPGLIITKCLQTILTCYSHQDEMMRGEETSQETRTVVEEGTNAGVTVPQTGAETRVETGTKVRTGVDLTGEINLTENPLLLLQRMTRRNQRRKIQTKKTLIRRIQIRR